jgi:coenzyme F420-reducing hydrogenase delta subunit
MRSLARSSVAASAGVLGGMLVIHCGEGGKKAVRRMVDAGLRVPEGVSFFELPCTGRVDESLLLEILESGVTDLLVVGCRKQNCKYLDGNLRGEKKLEHIRSILADAGLTDVHAEMTFVAPDEARRLHGTILDLYERISEGVVSGTDHAE